MTSLALPRTRLVAMGVPPLPKPLTLPSARRSLHSSSSPHRASDSTTFAPPSEEEPLTMLSASFLLNSRLPPLETHPSSSGRSGASFITPTDFARECLTPVAPSSSSDGPKPSPELRPAYFPSLVGPHSPYAWPALRSWGKGSDSPQDGGPGIVDLAHMRRKDDLEGRIVDVELSARGRGYGDGVRRRLREEKRIGRGGAGAAPAVGGGEDEGKELLWEKGRLTFGLFVDAFVSGKIPWSSGGAGSSYGDSPAPDLVGYVAQQDLFSDSPELSADCPPLPHQSAGPDGEKKQWRRNLWIGGADTFTPPHTDPYHNLYVQVVGYKRVHLFPPRSGDYLSLFPAHTGQGNTSALPQEDRLLCPDATSGKDLGAVRGGRSTVEGKAIHNDDDELLNTHLLERALEDPLARHVVLSPGDALFIPRGWYHCLRSLSTSVGVNAWFG